MTETPETAPDDSAPVSSTQPPYDGVLALLVGLANTSEEFELSVTVAVSGAVYTGELIGLSHFQRLQLETLRGASGQGADLIADALASAWSQADALQPDDPPVYFFHLRNARLIQGAAFTPAVSPGFLVRGRLSQVGAWALGGFSASE